MEPDICSACDLRWETSIFIRLYLPLFLGGLVAFAAFANANKQLVKTDLIVILALTYISTVFWVPMLAKRSEPYREWDTNIRLRRVVNYGSELFIAGIALIFYFNFYK